MRILTERLKCWFFRIENEIMLPFISVSIVVLLAFSVISFYNGYTMQMEYEKELAQVVFQGVRADVLCLENEGDAETLKRKYQQYGDEALRIVSKNGQIVVGPRVLDYDQKIIYTEDLEHENGWKLEYVLNMSEFQEELLEEQTYVIVGAVCCLLIIVQVCVFLAWSLTRPIRGMSATCVEIDKDKNHYRKYRFAAVERRDEIGQLARTLETLLSNLDNYTKMEYTSRMSATLAHEIKNPLTGIRSGVQVLRGRVEKENEKLLCDSMLHEIDRVTGLINNLFTLSVKKENKKEQFLLAPFLKEMEVLYERELNQRSIRFEVRCQETLTIYADGDELRQILHNVMINSMKAMAEGKNGIISLDAEALGNKAVLTLTDNGCGMTEEELERAREPFYTKSINGVGLGLAIVSRLTEKNLGIMELNSALGEGTSIKFIFYRERRDYGEGIDRG